MEAKAVSQATENCVASFLLDRLNCRHACLERIISDRGNCFTSHLVTELLRGIGSHPAFTTAYYPRTYGLVEHFNRTLATMLSIYVSTD